MPPRKAGTLLPLEIEILEVALSMLRAGRTTFHGFGIAQAIRAEGRSRSLTAHGTLYKALGRLEEAGLLASTWEDAAVAEGRPRRRLYELTRRGAETAAGATGPAAPATRRIGPARPPAGEPA